jgi:hypothetical protein
MSHKHAESIALFAEDAARHEKPWELWEFKSVYDEQWLPLKTMPTWSCSVEYRRIKKTIRIGRFEVPEPFMGPMKIGKKYFAVSLTYKDKRFFKFEWTGHYEEKNWVYMGIVQETEEGAAMLAEALISFCRISPFCIIEELPVR